MSRHRWGEIHHAMMVIEDFAKKYGEEFNVSRATLRSWVHRKYVSHYGQLYDLDDLGVYLRKRLEEKQKKQAS